MRAKGPADNNGFVCAFRGRRDNYQVPLALAEAGKLDQLITDLYAAGLARLFAPLLPAQLANKLSTRWHSGIPSSKVRSLWFTTALEHLRHLFGTGSDRTYFILDRHYSLAARNRARKTKSNLFLYSGYAWEAFTATYSHRPRKILFQFHPHIDFERVVLTEDSKAYPEVTCSYQEATVTSASEAISRERESWRHADAIICASSFTKQTLVEAGADPMLCKVVPYGIDLPREETNKAPTFDRFEALFVGSGIQRKGLHHLIKAWVGAQLPKHSRLTLVCRNIDPAISGLARQDSSIALLRMISKEELCNLYRRSSIFVMPSLIEGFGQVFLEALSFGCPVLGTPRTGLPDLGGEGDGIFTVMPGNIVALRESLSRLALTLPGNADLRQQARSCASRFPWSRFRAALHSLI
ncbi:MAG TPA: glycosyltransferase family 4 protein [Candidatus Udaeobacter sp.]|nr:glycosyltransferase family 4 protein [Candidatus Udaeobacter sp.]